MLNKYRPTNLLREDLFTCCLIFTKQVFVCL